MNYSHLTIRGLILDSRLRGNDICGGVDFYFRENDIMGGNEAG
jgi:hypothetical protein